MEALIKFVKIVEPWMKKIKPVYILWFILTTFILFGFNSPAHAGLMDDTASQISSVFGGGGKDQLIDGLQHLFTLFLTVGGIFVAYGIIVGIAATAADGNKLGGRSVNSHWWIIKIVIFTALLIPGPGGYPLGITLYGKLVKQSWEVADKMADTFTASNVKNVFTPTAPAVSKLAIDALLTETCRAGVDRYYAASPNIDAPANKEAMNILGSMVSMFGMNNTTKYNAYVSDVNNCGTLTGDNKVLGRYNQVLAAVKPVATKIANNELTDSGEVINGIQAGMEAWSGSFKSESTTNITQQQQSWGWAGFGFTYIAQSLDNTRMISEAAEIPESSSPELSIVNDYDSDAIAGVQKAKNLLKGTAFGLFVDSSKAAPEQGYNQTSDSGVLSVFKSVFVKPPKFEAAIQVNPISFLSEIGSFLFLLGTGLLIALIGISATIIGIGPALLLAPIPIGLIAMSLGLSYIPLASAVIWFGALLAYLFLLIESIVGVSLVCLFALVPSNEDNFMSQQIRSGVMLLFKSLFTPALLVLGCQAAFIIIPLAFGLLLTVIGPVTEMIAGTKPSLTSILLMFIGLFVIFSLSKMIIMYSFSYAIKLADHVFLYIGGVSGGSVSGAASEAGGAADKGIGSAASQIKGAPSAATQHAENTSKVANNNSALGDKIKGISQAQAKKGGGDDGSPA